MNQKLIDFKQKILEEPLSKTDKYWLEQVDFRTNQENELNLFVNSEFVKSSIEKKLYKKIKSVYKDVSGSDDCVFVLDKKLKKEINLKVPSVPLFEEKTIEEIIPLLVGVVNEGTAKDIKSHQYQIAGKTGTTVLNYARRKDGEKKKYQASFAGFFPADNPKYSCIVVINNPKNGQVYGGKVAAPIFKELADKVYALDMDIHYPMVASEEYKNLPKIKQGKAKQATVVLNELHIANKATEANYMVAETSDEEVRLEVRKVEEDLQNRRMPNLRGMNLQDAIYLLETYGLIVKCSGFGGIVKQSIKKGEVIKKGSIIKLELA